MSTKGDWSRVKDIKRYRKNLERIFNKEKQTVLPAITYKGIETSQNSYVFPAMERLLHRKVGVVIEIGTHYGGLTAILCSLCNLPMISFDIEDKIDSTEHLSKATRYIGDIFTDKCLTEAQAYIKHYDNPLVLCDGGNKIKEFRIFAPLLPKGGIIALHDYDDGENPVGKYWHNIEASYGDIKETVEKCNLVQIEQEHTWRSTWGAFQK